jgi:transposase
MRARLGAPEAITAAAHKLARIIFHLLTTHQAYDETVFARREEETRRRTEAILRNRAKALGFQLVPVA